MNKALIAIRPAEMRAHWDKIRPGLLSLIERGQNPGGWLPEDVFFMALQGQITVFLIEVNGEDDGFLILRKIDEFGSSRLHIWVLYSLTNKDVMAIFSDDLDVIANTAGCTSTSFGTTRKGWEKVAPKYGYSIQEVVYSRPVSTNSPQSGSAADGN